MRSFIRLLIVTLILVMMASLVGAQETAPGEGEPVVWGNQRGSANLGSLIRIKCDGTDCADILDLMYPGLLGVNYATSEFTPWSPDDPLIASSLATGWEVAEDGSSITVTMRDDMSWNDGTPITALDTYFFIQAALHPDEFEISSSFFAITSNVSGVEIIDDYTIRIDFEQANCSAILTTGLVVAMPAHAFGFDLASEADFDWSSLDTHPFNDEPAVTAGPFKFERAEPGTAIYMSADQTYPDAVSDAVIPEGLVYLDVPDWNVMAERLLADQPNDVNYMDQPDSGVVPTLIDGGAQVTQNPGDVWYYITMNFADPTNPQNGLDEDGNRIDQGHHPILGDVRVRQAIAHAVDIDEIIASAYGGNAAEQPAFSRSIDWTRHPDLERIPYDLDAARALLDEAGWVSTGDPLVDGGDGLRTCQGCLYDEEGAEMFMDIIAPAGARTDAGIILQASLAEMGVDVEVTTLDFNTLYDTYSAQTYDIGLAGWGGGVPGDPDRRDFFGVESDVLVDGWNYQSWYNEEFEELMEYINTGAVADGCDPEKIKEASWRAQEIFLEEVPYIVLVSTQAAFAASPSVGNFDPISIYGKWNMDAWDVKH